MKANYRTVDTCFNCKHCFIEIELVCMFYEEIPCDKVPTLADVVNLEKYLKWINRNEVQCNGICDNYEHRD
jgi:hypothetical protein